MKKNTLLIFILIFNLLAYGQTTVSYTQQIDQYDQSLTSSGSGGIFNNGTTEIGMWMDGDNTSNSFEGNVMRKYFRSGSAKENEKRSLQVGDEFTITVATKGFYYGTIGVSLNSGTDLINSWSDRISNSRIKVQQDGSNFDGGNPGSWYYATTATAKSFDITPTGSYVDYIIKIKLTTPNKCNITLNNTTFYDVDLGGTANEPITNYSIYMSDDRAGVHTNPNRGNSYWKQSVQVQNTGILNIGASNDTFTISDNLLNGLDANSTTTNTLNNSLEKSGTGTLSLSGENTYTGNTKISGGTLKLDKDLLSSSITIESGATLHITGTSVAIQSLTINIGGTLIVEANKQLTISTTLVNNGTINLLSDATGTATILTPSTITGAGTATVQQYLSSVRSWYMSSPVTGNAPEGNTYYQYDEPGNNTVLTGGETAYWESISAGSALTKARGYIVIPTKVSTSTFTGALNTGDQSIGLTRTSGVTKEGFNLVGNPYPSYLDISNIKTNENITPTYWYRSKNVDNYVFDTYNITSDISTGNSGLSTTSKIPPMQAFWLRVVSGKTSATLNLLNANRAHQDVTTNTFRAPAIETSKQQLLRLNISNGTNSDQTVLYFNSNASDDFDNYDSEKWSNNSETIPEIYFLSGTKKLVINGMESMPMDTEIPLGFFTKQQNTFTINALGINNIGADIKVILKDNMNTLEPEHELSTETPYSFTSDATTTDSRFSIIFQSAGSTTYLSNSQNNEDISIYKNDNNTITVSCSNPGNTSSATIYNTMGQKIMSKKLSGIRTVIHNDLCAGAYVIVVENNGKTITNKIIFE